MKEKIYKGYLIDKSQKDKRIFKTLNITNQKRIWLGLIKIYEIEVNENDLDIVIRRLQENLVSSFGLIKQEFYFHFYCQEELIIIYREKIFHATADRATWVEAQEYGKTLGIVSRQLDFLTPEENFGSMDDPSLS